MFATKIDEMLAEVVEKEQALLSELKELRDVHSNLSRLRGRMGGQPSLNWATLGISEATEKLLVEKGPLDTGTIAKILLERGITTKSKTFVPTVYATLRESKRFVRLPSRTWDVVANHPNFEPTLPKSSAKGKKKGKKKRAAKPCWR